MALTIRTKLTFWYTTLLTISILAFGVIFSYTLSRIIIDGADKRITSVADILARGVLRPPRTLSLPEHFDLIFERFFGIKTAGNYIQVITPDGRIEAKSSTLEDFNLPLSKSAYFNALHGRVSYETTKTTANFPIRIVTYPIMSEGRLDGILQVGASMEGTQEIVHATFYLFIFGGPITILLAGIIGWFLAGKTLKPVDKITQLARKIGAENLNERLKAPGPRDEIGRLAETFNEMIARLERSFRQMKQFTADASHELKTPLTIMKGEIEVSLKTEKSIEGLRAVLLSTLEETDRMSYIVKNLLDLARADTDEMPLLLKEVRLDQIISERFENSLKLAMDKGLELRIAKNTPVTVSGDPVALGQLIFNLINNAVKYTENGGRVELSLDTDKDSAIIKVADTGIGISKEDIPYILDRFYRVDKARTGGAGGAGLGLSICKGIVDAHGGRMEIESELGKGTTFIVYLPLARK
jgi:heavy metal sensor kinase